MEELKQMIDHVTFSVENLRRSRDFYQATLSPLGLGLVGEVSAEVTGAVAYAGFGIGRKGTFWLAERGRQTPTCHVCFRAGTRSAVRAFYAAALGAGGTDNGPPGTRPEYHAAYYAAFVLDPDGNNIEAVCFEAE